MGLPSAFKGVRHRRLGSLAAYATLAVTLAAGIAACGDSSSDVPAVPDGSVAIVGQDEITRGDLDDRVTTLRRVQRQSVKGQKDAQPTGSDDKTLEQQALSLLLQAAAIEQEAKSRGVVVTSAEVRQRWQAAAGAQFRNERQLRRFLGGQTKRDILDQLRLQLLNERILADVSEDAGGGKAGAKAAKDFQKEFQQRWREKTRCIAGKQSVGLCADR